MTDRRAARAIIMAPAPPASTQSAVPSKDDPDVDERADAAANFKRAAGFDLETVNSRASYVELPRQTT